MGAPAGDSPSVHNCCPGLLAFFLSCGDTTPSSVRLGNSKSWNTSCRTCSDFPVSSCASPTDRIHTPYKGTAPSTPPSLGSLDGSLLGASSNSASTVAGACACPLSARSDLASPSRRSRSQAEDQKPETRKTGRRHPSLRVSTLTALTSIPFSVHHLAARPPLLPSRHPAATHLQ